MPFSVFIIVPAGELFLPIALKLFPNMLPSTYEDQKQKDMKLAKLRTTRKDVSDFIRKTLRDGGLPISAKTRDSEEFSQFFRKVRHLPPSFTLLPRLHPPRSATPAHAHELGAREVVKRNIVLEGFADFDEFLASGHVPVHEPQQLRH